MIGFANRLAAAIVGGSRWRIIDTQATADMLMESTRLRLVLEAEVTLREQAANEYTPGRYIDSLALPGASATEIVLRAQVATHEAKERVAQYENVLRGGSIEQLEWILRGGAL